MADVKIAGILRAPAYSPNHIGNDATILNLVADQLRKRGYVVNTYSEEQLIGGEVKEEKVILNMCREERSLKILQQMDDDGVLVINSGYGVEICRRERMTRILMGSGIPHPDSIIVDTDEAVKSRLQKMGITQCWIKRGESHTMHKEDVSYARHLQEAQELLQEYFLRGIKRAVINRHQPGDLVKFYGVKGTKFFYWFFPFADLPARRGVVEQTEEKGWGPKFDEDALKDMCNRAADELEIIIYGGDCIVSPQGEMHIIDFNDWPSFAPCRAEAAPIIARRVMAAIKEHYSNKPKP